MTKDLNVSQVWKQFQSRWHHVNPERKTELRHRIVSWSKGPRAKKLTSQPTTRARTGGGSSIEDTRGRWFTLWAPHHLLHRTRLQGTDYSPREEKLQTDKSIPHRTGREIHPGYTFSEVQGHSLRSCDFTSWTWVMTCSRRNAGDWVSRNSAGEWLPMVMRDEWLLTLTPAFHKPLQSMRGVQL